MIVSRDGVYLESNTQVSDDGNLCDDRKLILIESVQLWGDLNNYKKVKGFSTDVVNELSNLVYRNTSHVDLSTTGDESGDFVIHLYNSLNGDLVLDIIDASEFDFDLVGSRLVVSSNSFNKVVLSEKVPNHILSSALKCTFALCNKNNVSEIFIVGNTEGSNVNSYKVLVADNTKAKKELGITAGSKSLILFIPDKSISDSISFPTRKGNKVYTEESIVYADDLAGISNRYSLV